LVSELVVSRLQDMNKPGVYSIQLEQADPGGSRQWVKSNVIKVTITPQGVARQNPAAIGFRAEACRTANSAAYPLPILRISESNLCECMKLPACWLRRRIRPLERQTLSPSVQDEFNEFGDYLDPMDFANISGFNLDPEYMEDYGADSSSCLGILADRRHIWDLPGQHRLHLSPRRLHPCRCLPGG
jgi:hypothetical protein